MKTLKNNEINVGVDTGKAPLDIFVRPVDRIFFCACPTGIHDAIRPEPTLIQAKNVRLIIELLTRRRQLMEMSIMEKNRLQIMPKLRHKCMKALLKTLQQQHEKIEMQLGALIGATDE